MNNEDVMNLPGTAHPVLLDDGKVGLLLVYPSARDKCGVQVPGEKEHRWVDAQDLHLCGTAMRQTGAPEKPPLRAMADPSQMLPAMSWVSRSQERI